MLFVFTAAKIKPFDLLIMLDFIKYNTPLIFSSDSEFLVKTFINLYALYWRIKVIKQKNEAFIKKIDSVARMAGKILIQKESLKHENARLWKTLITEQKHRKKIKMGILNKKKPGQAVFTSPTKIAAIRARREAEKMEKAALKEKKEQEKETKAKKKKKKAQKAKKRREKRAEKVAERKTTLKKTKKA